MSKTCPQWQVIYDSLHQDHNEGDSVDSMADHLYDMGFREVSEHDIDTLNKIRTSMINAELPTRELDDLIARMQEGRHG